jgi:hypothetical protein
MRHKCPRLSRSAVLLGLAAAVLLLTAAPAQAAVGPRYDIKVNWSDTNLPPGGVGRFAIRVRNVGDETGSEALVVEDQLPAGVKATDMQFYPSGDFAGAEESGKYCTGLGTEKIKCVFPGAELASLIEAMSTEGGEVKGYLATSIYVDVAISPTASGAATNTATVSGGGSPAPATDVDEIPFSPTPSAFGLVPGSLVADVFTDAYPFGVPSRQAGAHPFEQRVNFDLTEHTTIKEGKLNGETNAPLKTFELTLPRGLIGNPEATPKCDPVAFAQEGATQNSTACPPDTQIGYINGLTTSSLFEGFRDKAFSRIPLYNLEPPKGTPVDLGFNAGGIVQGHVFAALDPAQGYAIKTVTPNISSLIPVRGAEATVWGVPGDPAHDKFRYYTEVTEGNVRGAPFGDQTIRPFFTNPMDCGFENGGSRVSVESYVDPGHPTPVQEYSPPLDVSGCADPRFRFKPKIALQPTSRDAGGPTGLDVHLEVPQRNDEVTNAEDLYAANEDVKGIATPPLKKVVVRFPDGMTISPSAAQGLESCTSEEIGLGTNSPVKCPDASQYGTLTLHTPIFPSDAQPEGWIYIAKQGDNPFHNFLSIYLVIEEPERGILVKVPGKVDLDSQTGRITTTFDDLPQFPVSDMQMNLKGGVRAGLVNPGTCGRKTISAEFFTWQDPSTPHPVTSSYDVTQNPDGSPCPNNLAERLFKPTLEAGMLNPLAGAFSPLVLHLTRTDQDQELAAAEGTAPPGLTASLRGLAQCTDAEIKAAEAPGRSGQEEIASPSCPAQTQVGIVQAGAGVGQVLTYVEGKVYLAGPYKGAPVSGVAIVPAVAGPFDLGTIVTRAPAYVDPETAQITLKTDPLPQIFKGVPVRVRDIRVKLDRPSFTLNPTSCEPLSFTGQLFGINGATAQTQTRFEVGECASLGFKPKLSLKLKGGTTRGGHPALRAVLRARPGDANIAGAQVTLPYSEYLDQGHLNNICIRPDFAAKRCLPSTIYGHAVAKTPLFDQPLEGPVYLRANPNHNLPDLVAALRGPDSLPVEVDLQGRVDSVITRRPNGERVGGIRNTFEVVPDAPVTEFTLTMQGGKKGLLENSENLCTGTFRATAKFTAQNGKAATLHPALRSSCKGRRHHSGRVSN